MIRATILAAGLVAAGSTSITAAETYRIHDRPYYVAQTTVCVWREANGRDMRCRTAPEREYESRGECQSVEWAAIEAFAASAPAGYRVAARVRCIQSIDA